MLRELSRAECDLVLERHRVGRLGIRDAEGVYLVPICYAFDGLHLYGHAASGRKVSLMRRWPHVAFEVDEVEDESRWRSVLVRGRFEELSDDAEQARARLRLVRAFDGNPQHVTAGHGHRVALADAILFRIRIEDVSGRAEGFPDSPSMI
ncbi:MAG: flavin-nucleotide-binding protein [Anaerolinea sp.]|nr:flavin-nucleotide-binding protein [Anaerolinea sp.]